MGSKKGMGGTHKEEPMMGGSTIFISTKLAPRGPPKNIHLLIETGKLLGEDQLVSIVQVTVKEAPNRL